jgi:D-alanyl-D-alanine dipeptidase
LKLYNLAKENEKKFFAEPFNGTGSLHSHGCAVDVTLIDLKGKNVRMPTDFDTFTDEASVDYKGGDKIVEYNLIALQRAMQESGFFWLTLNWHYFVANNFEEYSII